MSYRKELGKVIRRHRKAMNMSQENLAEQCALSPHQISDIENGNATPKCDDTQVGISMDSLRKKPS